MKIFTIILFFTSLSYSQITKNNWLVGGSGNFKTTKTEKLSDGTKPYDDRTIFSISPNIGYFFYDKLAGGISLSYTYDNIFEDYQYFGVGPFVRYYFRKSDKMINPFLQTSYGFSKGKSDSGGSNESTGYTIKGGSAIFFNSSVALELSLNYDSSKFNSDVKSNNFTVGIGFQIHLEKK